MKNYLFIEGRRDAYCPEDVASQSLTVAGLIEILQEYDPESVVVLVNDRGYTYGKVCEHSIYEEEPED